MQTRRVKQKSQTVDLKLSGIFLLVPGAGVENMDIVKCKNKFLNPYYRCILLKYK